MNDYTDGLTLEWYAATLGVGEVELTVRNLLDMFNAKRRGYAIVKEIRASLDHFGMTTDPDFESAYIDSPIRLKWIEEGIDDSDYLPSDSNIADVVANAIANGVGVVDKTSPTHHEVEAAYRVSRLQSANSPITSVNPNASLTEAVTLMLASDYSQLPVMQGERDVKGVISWQTIGSRLAFNRSAATVQDLMEPAHEIRAELSVFQAIPIIAEHQYVLIRAKDNRIAGIVTSSDLNSQFQQLTEPFLQLAEIEAHIRRIIDQRLTPADMAEGRNPSDLDREVKGACDLTFGEYIRLFERPELWAKTGLPIDKAVFCRKLEGVRMIRNDVMHFDPDGIPAEDLKQLRDSARFFQGLQSVGVT